MNDQIKQIARRIKELREILEISQEEAAENIGVSIDDYKKYEDGELDIPIGVLYGLAAEFGVDPTVLLTGDGPRMDEYTVVRGGKGVKVDRYEGYSFTALASNFKNRDMDPMIVDISPSDHAELVTHAGQEFNLVLEGTVVVTIGKKDITLNVGDSIYFNPAVPHGQRAVSGKAKFLTIINE